MTDRARNPIAWTEGMFLRPHHLQHHDEYLQRRLADQLRGVDPFSWGVREFAFDEEALSDHRVEIRRLDLVFSDGSEVHYPGNATVESREFDPARERVEVWVGLRRLVPFEAGALPEHDGGRAARYRIQARELADVQRGGFETPIDVLVPNVRVFLSGEEAELDAHETIRLGVVEATGELKRPFALSRSAAPPLLRVQAFPPLEEAIARVVSQMAAKVRVVAGRTTTLAIADLPRMWMRYTLGRMTPLLRHLLSTGETRPWELYTALVETAGALASFALSEPAELPVYEHTDPAGCFRRLLEFIDTHLGEALPDRFAELRLPFDAQKRCYGTAELNVQLVDPRNSYFLGIKAPVDSQELAKIVEEHGKAGSLKGVPTLVMLNTSGLRIEKLPAAPTEIAARAGYEYFKVDPHGPQWSKVKDEYGFALSLGKLENADVRLYVVTAEG